MSIRPIARFVYGLMAVVFLAASAAVLLLGTGVMPAAVLRSALEFAEGSDRTMHFLQEFSTLLFLVGLVCVWCVLNYERSMFFQWAIAVFWGLFALVHWFDYRGGLHGGVGPVVNTVPVVVFVIVGVVRARTERANAAA